MSEAFDPYLHWLGIRDPQRPPNHYRLLGVELFESDPEIIQAAFDRQVSYVQKFQTGQYAAWSQQLLNELATAKITLLDPAGKPEYDLWLHQLLTAGYTDPACGDPGYGDTVYGSTPYAEPLAAYAQPAAAPEDAGFELDATDEAPPPTWTGLIVGLSLAAVLLLAAIAVLLAWRDRQRRELAAVVSAVGASAPAPTAPATPSPSPATTESPGTPREAAPSSAPAPPTEDAAPSSTAPEPADSTEAVEAAASQPPARSEQGLGELLTAADGAAATDSTDAAAATGSTDTAADEPIASEELPAKGPSGGDAIPEPSAQEAMRDEIRRIFQQEYAAASTPEAKRSLAELLVKQALDTSGDPVAYYVLLAEARDLAADAGDSRTFLQALVALSRKFPIDWVTMAAEGLEQAARRSRPPAANAALARAALKLVDGALRDDQYPQAQMLATAGRDMARKAADAELLKEAVARLKEVETRQQGYAEYQEAGQRLTVDPHDADARRIQAMYLCFVKGDWEHGLPLLAQSGDPALAALVEAENHPPADAHSAVVLGDMWWDVSKAAEPAVRDGMLARAAHWYRSALPHLRGLTETKVERRLEQIAAGGP